MPFGIISAPEVWQRTMHEFVEGLQGVEVIADDFIIAGFGDTTEEAHKSFEQNERSFFTRCREWNLKLNKQKVKRAKGLQQRTPSMTAVKCAPYKKFSMKMDFLYRPND